MYDREYEKLHAQLELPFLETKRKYLPEIFNTLENQFVLMKYSKQILIDLGSGNGQVVIFSALNYGIKSVGIEIDPVQIREAINIIKSLKRGITQKKEI